MPIQEPVQEPTQAEQLVKIFRDGNLPVTQIRPFLQDEFAQLSLAIEYINDTVCKFSDESIILMTEDAYTALSNDIPVVL